LQRYYPPHDDARQGVEHRRLGATTMRCRFWYHTRQGGSDRRERVRRTPWSAVARWCSTSQQ